MEDEALRERPALGVLPGEPDRDPLMSRSNASAFAVAPVDLASLQPIAASLSCRSSWMDGETVGCAQELVQRFSEPVGLDGGRYIGASVGGVRSLGGCSSTAFGYRRLQRLVRGLQVFLHLARELVRLLLGDDTFVGEPGGVLIAHAGLPLIRSAISGCVGRLVALAVAPPPIADQVDHHVLTKPRRKAIARRMDATAASGSSALT